MDFVISPMSCGNYLRSVSTYGAFVWKLPYGGTVKKNRDRVNFGWELEILLVYLRAIASVFWVYFTANKDIRWIFGLIIRPHFLGDLSNALGIIPFYNYMAIAKWFNFKIHNYIAIAKWFNFNMPGPTLSAEFGNISCQLFHLVSDILS